jgi:hypothetical protein
VNQSVIIAATCKVAGPHPGNLWVMRMVGVMMMSAMMMPVMRGVRKAGTGKKQHRGGKCNDLDHDSYPTLQMNAPGPIA